MTRNNSTPAINNGSGKSAYGIAAFIAALTSSRGSIRSIQVSKSSRKRVSSLRENRDNNNSSRVEDRGRPQARTKSNHRRTSSLKETTTFPRDTTGALQRGSNLKEKAGAENHGTKSEEESKSVKIALSSRDIDVKRNRKDGVVAPDSGVIFYMDSDTNLAVPPKETDADRKASVGTNEVTIINTIINQNLVTTEGDAIRRQLLSSDSSSTLPDVLGTPNLHVQPTTSYAAEPSRDRVWNYSSSSSSSLDGSVTAARSRTVSEGGEGRQRLSTSSRCQSLPPSRSQLQVPHIRYSLSSLRQRRVAAGVAVSRIPCHNPPSLTDNNLSSFPTGVRRSDPLSSTHSQSDQHQDPTSTWSQQPLSKIPSAPRSIPGGEDEVVEAKKASPESEAGVFGTSPRGISAASSEDEFFKT